MRAQFDNENSIEQLKKAFGAVPEQLEPNELITLTTLLLKNFFTEEVLQAYSEDDLVSLLTRICPLLRNEAWFDPCQCKIVQFNDLLEIRQDARILAAHTTPYIMEMVVALPNHTKGLRHYAINTLAARMKRFLEIRVNHIWTFDQMFNLLMKEMDAIDAEMTLSHRTPKLKPIFAGYVADLTLKINGITSPYFRLETLGNNPCHFCPLDRKTKSLKAPWEQFGYKISSCAAVYGAKNLDNAFFYEAYFETPRDLERFFALSFRICFYNHLLSVLISLDMKKLDQF